MAKARRKKKIVKKVKKETTAVGFDLALSLLSSGNSTEQVLNEVLEVRKQRSLSHSISILQKILSDARGVLAKNYATDKSNVVALHMARYNKTVLDLLNTYNPFDKKEDETEEEWEIRVEELNCGDQKELFFMKQRLTNCYYQALATMFQKEKILKMHSKGFLISITNKLNVEVKKENKKQYDLSNLGTPEKIDFLNLMLKAKKNEFEIGSVILRPLEEKSEIIDIEHEVIEEAANIDKIKHEEIPIKPVEPNGMALIDAKNRLAMALQKKAEEDFKKAGAKIDKK